MLRTQTHTLGCTCTSTLLYAFERDKSKGGKSSRRLSNAGLGSVYLLTQTAAHKITVVYYLWKDPLPHTMLSSSGDSSRVTVKRVKENGTQALYCMCAQFRTKSMFVCWQVQWQYTFFAHFLHYYLSVICYLLSWNQFSVVGNGGAIFGMIVMIHSSTLLICLMVLWS